MGYDAVRVRYRQQHRDVIRKIIQQKMTGEQMKAFAKAKAKKIIRTDDCEAFVEDVLEDLEQMDVSRLAGLGVTQEELLSWQEVL